MLKLFRVTGSCGFATCIYVRRETSALQSAFIAASSKNTAVFMWSEQRGEQSVQQAWVRTPTDMQDTFASLWWLQTRIYEQEDLEFVCGSAFLRTITSPSRTSKRWATFLFILLAIWLNFCLQDFRNMSFNLYKYAAHIELKNDCMNRIKSPLLRCGPYSWHALHGTWTQDISTFCCGLTHWVFYFWLPCYDACTSPVCDKVSRQQPVSLF